MTQLRAAFALTTRLEEQISTFRRQRIEVIKNGTLGHPVSPAGPTVVVHIVPFDAKGGLLPLGTGSNGHAYNLDRVYCFDELPACNAYMHFQKRNHRNGQPTLAHAAGGTKN